MEVLYAVREAEYSLAALATHQPVNSAVLVLVLGYQQQQGYQQQRGVPGFIFAIRVGTDVRTYRQTRQTHDVQTDRQTTQ